jgi:prevent-host-death family protein
VAGVRKIDAAEFKSQCGAILERVRRTGKPVVITRDGEPLAEIVPACSTKPRRRWLGSLAGTVRITGNIVSPASDESDWEALSDLPFPPGAKRRKNRSA